MLVASDDSLPARVRLWPDADLLRDRSEVCFSGLKRTSCAQSEIFAFWPRTDFEPHLSRHLTNSGRGNLLDCTTKRMPVFLREAQHLLHPCFRILQSITATL